MAGRGPLPTPHEVLRMVNPKAAPRRKGAALAGAGVPKCPKWVDAEGRRAWGQIAPLVRAGVINGTNQALATVFCDLVGLYVELAAACKAGGWTTKQGTGGTKIAPEAALLLRVADAIRQYADTLGLSPVGRARLGIEAPPPPEEDDLDSFVARRKS